MKSDEAKRESAGNLRNPLVTRERLIAAGLGLGGMIVGALVGIAVQMGVESTGLLGPSVEAMLAEQESNFDEMTARLEALREMSSDSEISQGLAQLGRLLASQRELQHQASNELAFLGDQVASLREESLASRGFAGGANMWLRDGEGVTVGDAQHVFGLVKTWPTRVDVNVNGKKMRMAVGDALPVADDTNACIIFFKQAKPRADGRVGFDVNCG